jgi:NTP pyrophosphatase (non-canonical NTP hydrolase)
MSYDLDDYQAEALRAGREPALGWREAACESALGITGEAGEVADLLKKQLFHGKAENADALCEELGDVLWYVANLARLHGLSLSEVAAFNLRKLRKRYPDGFVLGGGVR